VQDYLKTIYELRGDNDRATTNALATQLGVEAGSVTGMLKKLSDLKLIDYVPYQGARLTLAGEKIALEVIRHHRLLELYLMQAMGYSWDQVHAEADKLEHAISEEFEDTIARILGNPTTDPHGDPIPSKSGAVANSSRQTLIMALPEVDLRVQRVRDEDPMLLRRIAALGLRPGARLRVIAHTPANGAVRVRLDDGAEHSVESSVAESVFVETC
jgi:DtxR family transcriptional regulator, Mn-dependent transcriptional regulator